MILNTFTDIYTITMKCQIKGHCNYRRELRILKQVSFAQSDLKCWTAHVFHAEYIYKY